ncbi:MAG: VanZ family protein [Actinomycetota bacterium]
MSQSIDRYVIVAMFPIVIAAWFVARSLAARTAQRFALVFASSVSIGLILAVTLFGRMLELSSWGHGTLTTSWLTDSTLWSNALDINRPWLLNFGLFLPAGFFCSLAFRRTLIAVLSLTGLSFAIEFIQRWMMLGTADPADLVANLAGVLVGVMCTGAVRLASGR